MHVTLMAVPQMITMTPYNDNELDVVRRYADGNQLMHIDNIDGEFYPIIDDETGYVYFHRVPDYHH